MSTSFKEIHFKLSDWEWSSLFRIFPNQGERTAFFRACCREAIRLGPESRFVAQLRKRIEEETL
jgi:hypothetical protein